MTLGSSLPMESTSSVGWRFHAVESWLRSLKSGEVDKKWRPNCSSSLFIWRKHEPNSEFCEVHRDLSLENVLISAAEGLGQGRQFHQRGFLFAGNSLVWRKSWSRTSWFFSLDVPSTFPFPGFYSRVSHSKVHLNRPGADPSLQIKIIDFSMASTARIFRRLPDSDSVDSVDSVESSTCYPVLGQELH